MAKLSPISKDTSRVAVSILQWLQRLPPSRSNGTTEYARCPIKLSKLGHTFLLTCMYLTPVHRETMIRISGVGLWIRTTLSTAKVFSLLSRSRLNGSSKRIWHRRWAGAVRVVWFAGVSDSCKLSNSSRDGVLSLMRVRRAQGSSARSLSCAAGPGFCASSKRTPAYPSWAGSSSVTSRQREVGRRAKRATRDLSLKL